MKPEQSPQPPPRSCPLCGATMVLAQRTEYTAIYTCAPCRVTAQYPAERLGGDR